jgi:putative membrane protein
MEGKKGLGKRPPEVHLLRLFAVGLAGHVFEVTRGLMLFLSPYILLIASAMVVYPFTRERNYRLFLWCGIVLICTYAVEVVGVKTGVIFGGYTYGDVLGFRIFDVPIIIAVNWTLIVLGSLLIARRMTRNVVLSSLLAGLLAVVFDFLLEPVAIKLGYWQWVDGVPPLRNYGAWFIIAFLSSVLYASMKVKVTSPVPQYYICIQAVFFLTLNLVLG